MANTVAILSLVAQILPFLGSLFGFIHEAEQTGIPGPEKRAQVLDQMGTTWSGVQGMVGKKTVVGQLDWDKVLKPVTAGLLELGVAVENMVGTFSHKIPSAPEKW
jgi:hypothetical protein